MDGHVWLAHDDGDDLAFSPMELGVNHRPWRSPRFNARGDANTSLYRWRSPVRGICKVLHLDFPIPFLWDRQLVDGVKIQFVQASIFYLERWWGELTTYLREPKRKEDTNQASITYHFCF